MEPDADGSRRRLQLVPTSAFRRRARKLTPTEHQALAAALHRFQANPFDPSLRAHKLSGELAGTWAFSVTYSLRVICRLEGEVAYLLAVGSHDEVY